MSTRALMWLLVVVAFALGATLGGWTVAVLMAQ